jgi:hypothetical protein
MGYRQPEDQDWLDSGLFGGRWGAVDGPVLVEQPETEEFAFDGLALLLEDDEADLGGEEGVGLLVVGQGHCQSD